MDRQKQSRFSKRLIALRKGRGLTVAALSQKTGIAATSLSNYEYGFREPTGRILVTLEQAFGVSGAYIYGLTDNPKACTASEPFSDTTPPLENQTPADSTMHQELGVPKGKVEALIKDATLAAEINTSKLYADKLQRLRGKIDAMFNVIMLEALMIGLLLVCLAGLCWFGRQAPAPTTGTTSATTYHITQPTLTTTKTVEGIDVESLHPTPDYTVPILADHKTAVLAACTEYDVDPLVAFAVMQTESCYQANAENEVCIGYYQINTEYAWYYEEQLGVTGVADPLDNIQCGVWYLGQLIDRCDSLDLALMHYNLGNIADDYWADGITSTAYTKKVRSTMRELVEGAAT